MQVPVQDAQQSAAELAPLTAWQSAYVVVAMPMLGWDCRM